MNFPRQRLPYVTEFQLNNNKIKLIILQVNNFKKELPQLEPTKLIIIIIIIHRIKVSRISESTIKIHGLTVGSVPFLEVFQSLLSFAPERRNPIC